MVDYHDCVADCESPRVEVDVLSHINCQQHVECFRTHVAIRDSDGSSAELVVLLLLEDCQRSPTWSSRGRREIVSYCITHLVSAFALTLYMTTAGTADQSLIADMRRGM